jgi:hypothetical protein
MNRIKIRFASRDDSRVMADVMKRGQVICLRDLTFIVPEQAVSLLREMGARFEDLGEEPWDRVVRALRDSAASNVQ